ncbi:MAG: hypothetical protein ACMUIP_13605 [bacterium]
MISPALASEFREKRDEYNDKFATIHTLYPRLNPEIFTDFLTHTLSPIVDAVYKINRDRISDVIEALYDISLVLVAKGFIGPHSNYPSIEYGWRRLFDAFPHFIAASPNTFVTVITNALYNLTFEKYGRPGEWIEKMVEYGQYTRDSFCFLEMGKILAWRCGLTHYRDSALEVAQNLTHKYALMALTSPKLVEGKTINESSFKKLIDNIRSFPWIRPSSFIQKERRTKRLKLVGRVGGFQGFDGPFINPPRITVSEDTFIVYDNECCFELYADIFGCSLKSTELREEFLKNKSYETFTIDSNGNARYYDYSAQFPGLSGAASAASIGSTLAVVPPCSHMIFLIGLTNE